MNWRENVRKIAKVGLWAPVIMLIVISSWIGRNYVVHELPMMAFAGTHGLGRVVANSYASLERKTPTEIQTDWADEFTEKTGRSKLEFSDTYDMIYSKFKAIVRDHPDVLVKTYVSLMLENAQDVNQLYHHQLPQYKKDIKAIQGYIHNAKFTRVEISLALMGLVLIWLKNRKAAVFLTVVYIYIFMIVGFGQWQGSRLFYPVVLSSYISIAYFFCTLPQVRKILRK